MVKLPTRTIWKSPADGQWRYTIKGANGEIMTTSEGYTRKRDAVRGYDDLRTALGKIVAS